MRALLLFILAATMPLAQAIACSCAPPPSAEAQINSTDHIFRGTIVSGALSSWDPQIGSFGDVSAVVAVTDTYKGDANGVAIIGTALSSATCGVALTLGRSTVFFASREDGGPYRINLCGQAPYESNPSDYETALEALPRPRVIDLRRPIVIERPIRITPLRPNN